MAADPITANTVSDLFNYDVDSDDPFADSGPKNVRDDKAGLSPRAAKRRAEDGDRENFDLGLGLDEEVKITKKRKPNPKLDEARLLSKHGLPKLRALARAGISKKLRLKGKGHEFSDAAKLLNYYQLWLDDLYPRAKFADGLQIIEKVGHSKRMQLMRREWINEGKPGYAVDVFADGGGEGANDGGTGAGAGVGVATEPASAAGAIKKGDAEHDSDVDLGPDSDDLFFPDLNKQQDPDDGELDDDELDALLAEQSTTHAIRPRVPPAAEVESEGDDDLDALLAEETLRREPEVVAKQGQQRGGRDDGDKEAHVEALLATHESGEEISHGAASEGQSVVAEAEDGLDALLAEQDVR